MGPVVSGVLNVGVIDLPHPGGEKSGLTTGDLAEILEGKYELYSGFVELHQEDIAAALVDSLDDALDTIIGAGVVPSNPLAAAEQKVTTLLRTYFDNEEIAKLASQGVPTAAALKGVNHRLKLSKGPRRPSFIDTGALRAASDCWTEVV